VVACFCFDQIVRARLCGAELSHHLGTDGPDLKADSLSYRVLTGLAPADGEVRSAMKQTAITLLDNIGYCFGWTRDSSSIMYPPCFSLLVLTRNILQIRLRSSVRIYKRGGQPSVQKISRCVSYSSINGGNYDYECL
jgi:hypothetical protein